MEREAMYVVSLFILFLGGVRLSAIPKAGDGR